MSRHPSSELTGPIVAISARVAQEKPLRAIAASSVDGNIVRSSPALFQPIAADDVAVMIAEVALVALRNGIVEIAGPEQGRSTKSSPAI
jgi:hypothetical protein